VNQETEGHTVIIDPVRVRCRASVSAGRPRRKQRDALKYAVELVDSGMMGEAAHVFDLSA
jgi:hypothetical protein